MSPSITGEDGGLFWLAVLFVVVSVAFIYGGPSEPRNP